MEIWLDTCDIETIKTAGKFGIIFGVTTNPSLLAEAGEIPQKIIQSILDEQDGPVAVQVMVEEHQEMIKQAQALRVFSDRIIVKIPVTQQGLMAIKALSEEEIPVMATTIFHPNQALLASLAGAEYVAPYVGRILDSGVDAFKSLHMMANVNKQYQLSTKILAAALRTPEQIMQCAEIGIDAVTLKTPLFSQFLTDNPQTLDCLKAFAEAWKAHNHSDFEFTSV